MTFLDDAGLAHLWSKIRAALSTKQNSLTGAPGQAVGFDPTGRAVAQIGWSNPNLLDNWYFPDPINQKGRATYLGAGYTIDRWRITGRSSSLSLGTEGIRFTGTANTNWCKSYVKSSLAGQTVTVSVLGIPLTPNGQFQAIIQTTDPAGKHTTFTANGSNGFATLTAPIPKDAVLVAAGFRTFLKNGTAFATAAKLELGRNQTLAHQDEDGAWVLNDPPPDKALELAKCQRYYQIFTDKALRPTRAADFRPPMRVDPALGTIDIGGTTYYTADANL